MEPKDLTSARDHPTVADDADETPEIEVYVEEVNPEDYVAAILADMDRDVAGVGERPDDSDSRRPDTIIPPATMQAAAWDLGDVDVASSRPALTPMPLPAESEDRFTFPPPVSQSASSIAPISMTAEEEEDEDIFRPPVRARARRSERLLLVAFAAVGVAVVGLAAYDIGRSTTWGTTWENLSTTRRVAAAVDKLEVPPEPTHELAPVVIEAEPAHGVRTSAEKTAEPRVPRVIPFDPGAASMALDVASAEALTRCTRGARDPVSVNVRVTFDPSGRASSVAVEGSDDASPATRLCTQRVFSKVTIPGYTGEPMTFTRWLRIK